MKNNETKECNPTDKIWNVVAIRESAIWSMGGGEINAIRRRVCSGSGCQEVVVAIINQWISKDEESPSSLSLSTKSSQCHDHENDPWTKNQWASHGIEGRRGKTKEMIYEKDWSSSICVHCTVHNQRWCWYVNSRIGTSFI